MKNILLISFSLFMSHAQNVLAGGNVSLQVSDISKILVADRASNAPEYMELQVQGKVTQTDAYVPDLSGTLPQSVRILVKKTDGLALFNNCKEFALVAKNQKGVFSIELFMKEPNVITKMIQGGMADPQFNAFVIPLDSSNAQSIACSYQ